MVLAGEGHQHANGVRAPPRMVDRAELEPAMAQRHAAEEERRDQPQHGPEEMVEQIAFIGHTLPKHDQSATTPPLSTRVAGVAHRLDATFATEQTVAHPPEDWMLGRIIDRVLRLPPAVAPNPVVRRDIAIPMPDGVTLLADWYRPSGFQPLPVVLIRTPYGRRGLLGALFGSVFARRGLQVVIQSVRGTFGSGGEFRPFHHEKDDGLATVAWLREQPWCDGRVAMAGASYLGHTQWAIAPYADPPLDAMCLGVTASEFVSAFYPGGALALDDMVSWSALIGRQEDRFAQIRSMLRARRVRAAMSTLPISRADVAAVDRRVGFLAEVTGNAENLGFWSGIMHKAAGVTTPITMFTGWYDLFLPAQLRDFQELRAAGNPARITIGPWSHGEPGSMGPMIADQADFLAAHLLGDRSSPHRAPVRLCLQHANRWLDFEEWPPKSSARRFYLPELSDQPDNSAPDEFTYDPADPTPSIGGPLLAGKNKQQDNREIEARPDVLVYTGEPLTTDLDVIGEPTASVYVQTDRACADVFVRLCDVDARGVSRNVTEGIVRLVEQADGSVEVALWPTAYRFRRGHRMRVQIAGGAFPRFSRNHGTGEPVASAIATQKCHVRGFHDINHPSFLTLPVFSG
jgi:uncharacterized protein